MRGVFFTLLLLVIVRVSVATELPITYTLAGPGQVSVAVYTAQGTLVRTLLSGVPQAQGRHTLTWDGLDRLGRAVEVGSYRYRVLRTPGFEAKYLTTLGTNPGTHAYDPWVGNHTGTMAVAVDESGVYLAAACAENVPAFLKQSPDGTTRYWQQNQFEAWMGGVSMACTGERLYILQQNGKVQVVKPTDAAKMATWEARWAGDTEKSPAMDLDAVGQTVVVSYRGHDAVRWLDPEKGTVLLEETVKAPARVALGDKGQVYVISANQVVALFQTPNGVISRVIIPATALTQPQRLAFDRRHQHLLVAEGAESHQVKRFNLEGVLVQSYGRAGGRAYGKFVPEDFRELCDIAADGQGGFFTVEQGALRRVAHVDREGHLLGQWFGAQPFFNFAAANPANPLEVYYMDSTGGRSVATIDEKTGTWRLQANYRLQGIGEGLFPDSTGLNCQWHVRAQGGQTYLYTDGGSTPAVLRVDEKAGTLVPVAIAGPVERTNPPARLQAALAQAGYTDLKKAPPSFAWTDRNGDGVLQPEEFTFCATTIGGGRPLYIDERWQVYLANGNPQAFNGAAWLELPNTAPAGTMPPSWDWNALKPAPARLSEEMRTLGTIEARGIWRDAQGGTYLFFAANRNPYDDRHGEGWPTNRNGSCRLAKWNAAGELEWTTGKHAVHNPSDVKRPSGPGEFHDPARLLGMAHDCLIIADRSVHPAVAYTADGLYAGSFLDRRAADGLPAYLYAWWRDAGTMHPDTPIPYDCLLGGTILPLPDGEVLWLPMGENATPVYRVRGWDDWERAEGAVTVKTPAEHAQHAGTGLQAAYFANPRLEGEPATQRLDARVWFDQLKRGQFYGDWSKAPAEGVGPANFSVRWTGSIEPLFSEDYTICLYTDAGGRARVWIDETLVVDDWPAERKAAKRPAMTYEKLQAVTGTPLPMVAGRRYRIRVEYANQDGAAAASLVWESRSQERQRIPTSQLYPQ